MRKILFAVPFALFMLYGSSASAMGASAGVLVGNGFKDAYNLGLGVRGGITLPMSLYVGGTFVWHNGTTVPSPIGDAKANLFYFGAEGGYDASVGPITIRPYLGLGYTSFRQTSPESCLFDQCAGGSQSEGKFTLWPGVTGLFTISSFFVGADLRYVIPTGVDDGSAFSMFATGGLSF